MGLITLQVLLGVEAWIGKFLTGTLPEFERFTRDRARRSSGRPTPMSARGCWPSTSLFALIVRRNPADALARRQPRP